jgi:hypothetical protein
MTTRSTDLLNRRPEVNFKGFSHCFYVGRVTDCEWVFAVFSKAKGPSDVQYMLSFRARDRTRFGYKELQGMAWGRDVRRLVTNVIANKAFRRALLSNDPELAALWKRTRS